MNKIPMTVEGFNRLQEELKRLKSTDRPAIIRAIAEARTHGDLAENAEYHAARERQSFIEGRVAELAFLAAVGPGGALGVRWPRAAAAMPPALAVSVVIISESVEPIVIRRLDRQDGGLRLRLQSALRAENYPSSVNPTRNAT